MRRYARVLLVIGLLTGCGRLGAAESGPGPESSEDPSDLECSMVVSSSGDCWSPDPATVREIAVMEAELSCGDEAIRGSYGYEGGGKPGAQDPISGTEARYVLEPQDRVERTAGGEDDATIEVRRDGGLIIAVHWTDHPHIGWLADAFAVCDLVEYLGGE